MPTLCLIIGILLGILARVHCRRRDARDYWKAASRCAARAAEKSRKCDDRLGRMAELHDCIATNPAVAELTARMHGRKSA